MQVLLIYNACPFWEIGGLPKAPIHINDTLGVKSRNNHPWLIVLTKVHGDNIQVGSAENNNAGVTGSLCRCHGPQSRTSGQSRIACRTGPSELALSFF